MATPLFEVPPPESRLSGDEYLRLREWLLKTDPDAPRMVTWADQSVAPPETPEAMAADIIWIILCAGRRAQAARTLEKRVWEAINESRPVVEAFAYRAKAQAIERAWAERATDFQNLQGALASGKVEDLVAWCGSLPFVGDDTQFQLAKNFGADVCKPDIWLCRLTGIADKPRRAVKFRFPACMAFCRYLAAASGDKIGVVDSVLWLACNKGALRVSADGGPVDLCLLSGSARSIYEAKPN